MWRSDPKWQEAHYMYRKMDCDAEFSKFDDTDWQNAYDD